MKKFLWIVLLAGLSANAYAGIFSGRNNGLPPFVGYKDAPSAAQAVNASSTTQVIAVYVPVSLTLTGARISVGTASGNCQVGLYDATGTLLASSSLAACPAAGAKTISFTSNVAVPSGTYYLAVGADNITQTFGKASGASVIGCNWIANNIPMAATITLPGAATTNCFAAVGLVSGGVIQ